MDISLSKSLPVEGCIKPKYCQEVLSILGGGKSCCHFSNLDFLCLHTIIVFFNYVQYGVIPHAQTYKMNLLGHSERMRICI